MATIGQKLAIQNAFFSANSGTGKLLLRNSRLIPLRRSQFQKVVATAPTITVGTTSAMTSPFYWPAASGNGAFPLQANVSGAFSFPRASVAGSPGASVSFINTTSTTAPAYSASSSGFSCIHDGQQFEFVLGGTGTFFVVKVDDEYVSLTPTTIPANGGSTTNCYLYDFGSVKRRRIDVVGYNLVFFGANTGQTDSLQPAPLRGPLTIFLGDSFTNGNDASGMAANNYVAAFADYMGWDQVWASGVGGTGYLATNAGASPTFRGRVQHDVIALNPEVVFIVGSVNDDAQDPTAMGVEASLLYAQLRSALPNAVICAAPTAKGGANTMNSNKLAIKAAMKAAAIANGVVWLDPLEMPLSGTASSGALTQGYSAGIAGTSGIRFNFVPQAGAVYEVGSAATVERIQCKSFSQASLNNYNCFFDGTSQYAHATGATVTQVGPSYLTGHGKVGTTTGFGNSDLFVDTDGTHPVTAGHVALGLTLADLFLTATGPN